MTDRKNADQPIITWFSMEDKLFIAEVPHLPGCVAYGQTEEEALDKIRNEMNVILLSSALPGTSQYSQDPR